MLHILTFLKSQNQRICAYNEDHELTFFSPHTVLYVDTVEERTFLYCDESVYETSLTLTELTSKYEDMGFFRISKSMIVNLHRIKRLRSIGGGRIEAILQNQEKIIISRHYAPLLRQQLGL